MISDLVTIGRRALSHIETLRATYSMARICLEEGIKGDFVECGVFAGAQVAAMARAIENEGKGRKIHLFDSFAGIPKAGPEDAEDIAGLVGYGEGPSGQSVCTIEQVRQHMKDWKVPDSLLVYHEGWFEDTVPGWNQPIALLRLDGDLYESTKVCMEHLYPHLVRGGWLIVDDFALQGCRKAVMESLPAAPVYFRKLP